MKFDVYRLVLPLVPEAVALVAGLFVLIAFRRRLGAAAAPAFGGVGLLALATAGEVVWTYWVLSREWAPVNVAPEDGSIPMPTGLQLARDLDEPVRVALLMIYLVGLVLLASALFAGRRAATMAGRAR
ncbi:hypothetical protein ACTMTJ_27425 [Phytohabitans sp. LJ34]|uniref:hypothetical protein n=1 Tax=Phytohabitans sp. LJ34 TaxID=3452217 RepID=UPI003F8C1D7B